MRRASGERFVASYLSPRAASVVTVTCAALFWGMAAQLNPATASVSQRPPADALVKAASEAILSGHSVRASTLLDPLVRSKPQDLEARGLLAVALYLSNQWFQAEGQAYLLRQQDPSGRRTAFLVSRRLLVVFRVDTPVAAQLIDLLARGGTDGFLWLAQIYEERGRYDDAATILTRGASRFPASAPLQDALGFSAWKAGRLAAAIAAYHQAILYEPDSWRHYFNLGWVFYTGRQYSNAATAWREARRLNPAHPVLPKLIADAERKIP